MADPRAYPTPSLYGLFAYQDPAGPSLDLYRETGTDGVLVVLDGAEVRVPAAELPALRAALDEAVPRWPFTGAPPAVSVPQPARDDAYEPAANRRERRFWEKVAWQEAAETAGDPIPSDAPRWVAVDDMPVAHVVPGMTDQRRRDPDLAMVTLCGRGPWRSWQHGWAWEMSRSYTPCGRCTELLRP